MKLKLFRYYGGKHWLAGKFDVLVPNHKIYVEPFFGSGSVYLNMVKNAKISVLNDKSFLIYCFLKALRDNNDALIERIKFTEYSEAVYLEALEKVRKFIGVHYNKVFGDLTLEGVDYVDVAWSVWVVLNFGFGGKLEFDRYFSGWGGRPFGFENKLESLLYAVKKLQKAIILNSDFVDVVSEFDSGDTFFYFDPPYQPGFYGAHYNSEVEYVWNTISDLLCNLKGKFVLSMGGGVDFPHFKYVLDDRLRRGYWWKVEVKRPLRVNNTKFGKKRDFVEILVSNYNLEKILNFDLEI